jgi:hypothetical protein
VEFWEVFLKKGARVFKRGAPFCHVLAADSLTSSRFVVAEMLVAQIVKDQAY